MKSQLKLYKACKITPEKNFKVDNLEDYLSSLEFITINNFQYIKHDLNITIKINRSQEFLNPTTANNINYIAISNVSDNYVEKTYYYFVINKKWTAEETISLTLRLDSVNTFIPSVDFNFNDKTKINRQHKDRFKAIPDSTKDLSFECNFDFNSQNGYQNRLEFYSEDYVGMTTEQTSWDNLDSRINIAVLSLNRRTGVLLIIAYTSGVTLTSTATLNVQMKRESYGATHLRVIDLASEGLTPMLYGESIATIEDSSKQDWYLVYKSSSDAIRCLLYAQNELKVNIRGTNYQLTPNDLTAGTYYFIFPEENNGRVTMTTADGSDISSYQETHYETGGGIIPFEVRNKYVVCYNLSNGSIRVRVMRYNWTFFNQNWTFLGVEKEYFTTEINFDSSVTSVNYRSGNAYSTTFSLIKSYTSGSYSMAGSQVTIPSVNYLDKTDKTLIKIIKCPYRPTDDNFTGWLYDSTDNVIYLNNLETPLEEEITFSIEPLRDLLINLSGIDSQDDRSDVYESKLFHSDYYQYKFIYDSFSFVFALEKINIDLFEYWNSDTLKVTFTATNSINSRFLFTFTQYVTEGKSTEDYDNILYIARNNEVTIYNNDYVNYIKTGYNYDVKTKQRQELGLWASTGLSIAGAIASFALGGPVGAGIGVSLATSSMSQLINAVNSTAQAEANHEQKLAQLRQQKTSVYGADDLDLMTRYTGNRAKVMLYKVSERVKKTLYDLFFYTGYVDGTLSVPNVTSRTHFNFVSCEPVFDYLVNIPDDIVEDLTLKYNAGVTFLHKVDNSWWDFAQEFENWETSLLNS